MLYQFTFVPTVYEYSGCFISFSTFSIVSYILTVCVCDISLMTNNL